MTKFIIWRYFNLEYFRRIQAATPLICFIKTLDELELNLQFSLDLIFNVLEEFKKLLLFLLCFITILDELAHEKENQKLAK